MVMERMLQFYERSSEKRKANIKKKGMKSLVSSFPFVVLLNFAVTSIKHGMWDSIYDSIQAIAQHGPDETPPHLHPKYESIDVESSRKDVPVKRGKFVLNCLNYLPSEFHGLATGVLLSGMRSWIDDYHQFSSSPRNDEVLPAAGSDVSCNRRVSGLAEEVNEDENLDAALVIESIRRDKFGLDQNLSDAESSLLKKQHAHLGRALHCLSQELYSQGSHFLLELVSATVLVISLCPLLDQF
ncbi:hypothetical protein ACFE04_015201 [Oxalis oulophora]